MREYNFTNLRGKFKGQQFQTIVDNEDAVIIDAHLLASKIRARRELRYAEGYACVTVDGQRRPVKLHVLIMKPPKGMEVDHINRNRLDNRRSNLRVCSKRGNQTNQPKRRHMGGKPLRSKFKGVEFSPKCRRQWVASIKANGKQYYLGSYNTEVEAAAAYDGASFVLHGEFGFRNNQPVLRKDSRLLKKPVEEPHA